MLLLVLLVIQGENWGEEIDKLAKESYLHLAFPFLDLVVEKENTNELQ